MTLLTDTMFSLLDQKGAFATLATPLPTRLFSPTSRAMVKLLKENNEITKYRILCNQVFDLLDVHSFAEIHALIHSKERRAAANRRAYGLIGNMFGINGNEREIIATVNNYSRTADSVIRYLKSKVLNRFASHVEMTNEVDATSSPVDLLLIIFDDRYHAKARFEAKRKLLLMNLAGSIDQRERETDIEAKFANFLHFLNEHVWLAEAKIGELELVYLLSNHSPEDFSCLNYRLLSRDEGEKVSLKKGQKLTLLKRRHFKAGGREIPIYVSIRKKTSETKVLKLLRKGEENPAVAVDDELGLMGVLDHLPDVKLFQNHLTRSAIAAHSFMVLEDISDSLTTGRHRNKNIGSSAGTRMFKFFARMGGMRVEFIVHTNESYLDYMYKRDVAHDEYEVKRIFDSGTAELLFPPDIYFLDMKKARNQQIAWFRAQIESN
ncbi:MAG: hypothetical protein KKD73_09875 [Proteobacteria bacterium]|nr:hypothetical protein [Pseudomonadota bacterium]MBU1639016.1 hypothetical protein [Pseudomonadota bacterium]